jgi:putative ABC transport system substrate-binding protein
MGTAETPVDQANVAIILTRLEQLGWKSGRNLGIDLRWWTGTQDQMHGVIADVIASRPDVLIAFTNLALATLMPMASNIPVVFVGVGDPVGSGFVASLANPGGNITGFSSYDGPMASKWLQILKEIAPQLIRVIALLHPETPSHQTFWRAIEAAAPRLGVEITPGAVYDAADIERAVSSFAKEPNGGVIILPHALTNANLDLIIALTLRYRLPSIMANSGSGTVNSGGLAYYGVDFGETFGQTAEYVDRILRGERPGDLPVQQPTKFKFALNLKTARALGLTISPQLLALADEVIE